VSRPKEGTPFQFLAELRTINANGIGHARLIRDTLADRLQRDYLDRLIRPSAVTVGALMFLAEGLLEFDRALSRNATTRNWY
jgi:hypothetical protein